MFLIFCFLSKCALCCFQSKCALRPSASMLRRGGSKGSLRLCSLMWRESFCQKRPEICLRLLAAWWDLNACSITGFNNQAYQQPDLDKPVKYKLLNWIHPFDSVIKILTLQKMLYISWIAVQNPLLGILFLTKAKSHVVPLFTADLSGFENKMKLGCQESLIQKALHFLCEPDILIHKLCNMYMHFKQQ